MDDESIQTESNDYSGQLTIFVPLYSVKLGSKYTLDCNDITLQHQCPMLSFNHLENQILYNFTHILKLLQSQTTLKIKVQENNQQIQKPLPDIELLVLHNYFNRNLTLTTDSQGMATMQVNLGDSFTVRAMNVHYHLDTQLEVTQPNQEVAIDLTRIQTVLFSSKQCDFPKYFTVSFQTS